MLVIRIPCAFLVVVFQGEILPCLLLINFIEDLEIDCLLTDLVSWLGFMQVNIHAENGKNLQHIRDCIAHQDRDCHLVTHLRVHFKKS